jgi:type II secretory pathway predicted ATPase ExeA
MTKFEEKVGRNRRLEDYLQRWGLEGDPFKPELTSAEAFAPFQETDLRKLKCVLSDGKVGVLTGGLGAGKTTVCEFLISSLKEESLITKDSSKQVVAIFVHGATYKSTDEFLRAIILGLEMNADKDRASLFEILHRWPQEHRERLAIIIDDVSESGADMREIGEFLRVLADIPGIALLLNGTPNQMEQFLDTVPALKDRVQVKVELMPMNRGQVEELIRLRLRGAGCTNWDGLVTPKGLEELYKTTGGVPRGVLKAASNALYYAAEKNTPIDARAVKKANKRSLLRRIFPFLR